MRKPTMLRRSFSTAAIALGLLLATKDVQADLTFTGSDSSRSAMADFSLSGGTLTITLTNNYAGTTPDPGHVLTALFFDMTGHTLSTAGASAFTNIGSTIINTSADNSGFDSLSSIPHIGFGSNVQYNVGGEWAYLSSLSGAPNQAHQGISSSGFSLFDQPNLNGVNLQDPTALDGVQYGIVSAGGTAGGNAAVTSQNALIQNSVVFKFKNTGLTSLDGLISNVSFQYGTTLNKAGEPNIPGTPGVNPVPEPTTMLIATIGAIGFVSYGVKRRKVG